MTQSAVRKRYELSPGLAAPELRFCGGGNWKPGLRRSIPRPPRSAGSLAGRSALASCGRIVDTTTQVESKYAAAVLGALRLGHWGNVSLADSRRCGLVGSCRTMFTIWSRNEAVVTKTPAHVFKGIPWDYLVSTPQLPRGVCQFGPSLQEVLGPLFTCLSIEARSSSPR